MGACATIAAHVAHTNVTTWSVLEDRMFGRDLSYGQLGSDLG